MLTIKTLHVCCAYLTGVGFLLRGWLALTRSPLLQLRITKTLPHIIDTILLLSALAMIHQWSISISNSYWLIAKIVVLFVYIIFGFLMLRYGHNWQRRFTGFLGGVLSYTYIVGVAHSKSVLFPISLF